jgi:tetratricopeptide (TPR) repeat protein
MFESSFKLKTGHIPRTYGKFIVLKQKKVVEKNYEGAIILFWKAINGGDRVDSAVKDMVVVMKQLDRSEEAIEAIKSFRHLCSKNAQQSLDNLLLDLYKKCGRVDEEIALLKQKLRLIYRGEAFNGKPTKTARSHGKKFKVSINQEISRILGNLGWAYMQKRNYIAAEVVYRKAQIIDEDANKACNLALCLIKQARFNEARPILHDVINGGFTGSEDVRTRTRAHELLSESQPLILNLPGMDLDDDFVSGLEKLINEWAPNKSRRLPIFEEISEFRNQLAC